MTLLLDTHALLWWLADDAQLGARVWDEIADPDATVLVSVVSLWEIIVKVRIGRLEADVGAIAEAAEQEGFTLLDIGRAHLLALYRLAPARGPP